MCNSRYRSCTMEFVQRDSQEWPLIFNIGLAMFTMYIVESFGVIVTSHTDSWVCQWCSMSLHGPLQHWTCILLSSNALGAFSCKNRCRHIETLHVFCALLWLSSLYVCVCIDYVCHSPLCLLFTADYCTCVLWEWCHEEERVWMKSKYW